MCQATWVSRLCSHFKAWPFAWPISGLITSDRLTLSLYIYFPKFCQIQSQILSGRILLWQPLTNWRDNPLLPCTSFILELLESGQPEGPGLTQMCWSCNLWQMCSDYSNYIASELFCLASIFSLLMEVTEKIKTSGTGTQPRNILRLIGTSFPSFVMSALSDLFTVNKTCTFGIHQC